MHHNYSTITTLTHSHATCLSLSCTSSLVCARLRAAARARVSCGSRWQTTHVPLCRTRACCSCSICARSTSSMANRWPSRIRVLVTDLLETWSMRSLRTLKHRSFFFCYSHIRWLTRSELRQRRDSFKVPIGTCNFENCTLVVKLNCTRMYPFVLHFKEELERMDHELTSREEQIVEYKSRCDSLLNEQVFFWWLRWHAFVHTRQVVQSTSFTYECSLYTRTCTLVQ